MNALKKILLKLRFALLAVVLLTVYGCGGGGGGGTTTLASYTLSGTAAAGAPIIGTVTVKDSSNPFKTKTVTIAADGRYTIDVNGMTAPFMLNATGTVGGTSYNLHSAAVSTDINGNINITPLTDLIVANVAGQIASTYFATGNFSALTAAELAGQETALQARLQNVLSAVPGGVGAAIDLLRSSFATDHTGLDAALDVLRVAVDPTTVTATITNIIDNQQIIDNLASQVDNSVIVATNVGVGLTELQQIVAGFNAFGSLFATSLPAPNNATLLALFDTNFLLEGQNTAEFLAEITTDPTLIGVQFTNISLVPGSMTPVEAPTTAKIVFTVIQGGGNGFPVEFTVNKVGDAWKMAGDRRIAQANAMSFARLQDVFINNVLQTNYIDTGLTFEIKAPTVTGLNSIGAVVPDGVSYYAIVTGAGLPVAGALYVSDFAQAGNSFRATSASPSGYLGNATPNLTNFGHNQYPLLDDVITTLADNAIYTIKICHDNATVTLTPPATVTPAPAEGVAGVAACQLGADTVATSDDVLLATYTSNAGKRPYLNTELSVASFAAITAPSKTALTAFANAGGTITVSWTLSATTLGAKPESLHYFRGGSTGSDNADVNLVSTATSVPLTMSSLATANIGTLCANGINLRITDSFSRELTTIYNGDQSGQNQACALLP